MYTAHRVWQEWGQLGDVGQESADVCKKRCKKQGEEAVAQIDEEQGLCTCLFHVDLLQSRLLVICCWRCGLVLQQMFGASVSTSSCRYLLVLTEWICWMAELSKALDAI